MLGCLTSSIPYRTLTRGNGDIFVRNDYMMFGIYTMLGIR